MIEICIVHNKLLKIKCFALFALLCFTFGVKAQSLKVLNFYGDNGFVHASQKEGIALIEELGQKNTWEVVSSNNPAVLSPDKLLSFDVVIFNNNCGNKGPIMNTAQHQALQQYIQNGGGFVGIHCAGAVWKEGGAFQQWYEGLIGTRLINHPKVQEARLIVEDRSHSCTAHLPEEWMITDEWHRFSVNPREKVHVLISLDENSYEGEQKMGGDHPFTWLQHYDGGRSFFTSLGHTKEIYANPDYQKMLEQGILWAAGCGDESVEMPVNKGILLDLDADYGVQLEDGDKIVSWTNKVENSEAKVFVKQDEGRNEKGSGRPRLQLNVPKLNGHNSVVFHRQELLNHNEDAFDHLITGSGYTWFAVLSAYQQVKGKPGVNSFFGNLRNTNVDKQGQYEGFWGGLSDSNQVWMGARNALEKGLWNENNPHVLAPQPLETARYYLLMGRMGAGTDSVDIELFVNSTLPLARSKFWVNPSANASKLAIGQERDATNHPGKESFDGEIARFLLFEGPLSDMELLEMRNYLVNFYGINVNPKKNGGI